VTKVSLAEGLAQIIQELGPISVAKYMGAANAHYYASRDPLGAAGDFTTAPEISQMFGELVGLWLADLWIRSGRPPVHYVELGPGRGTLANDALRAMASIGLTPTVHFVETSPVLRAHQATAVPKAIWHDHVGTLPTDAPLLIVANEFFDALPIHQIIKTEEGWCQRVVNWSESGFSPSAGKRVPLAIIPENLSGSPVGSIIESSPDTVDITRQLAQRIGEQSGAALFIDYGYDGPAIGDTLQAVSSHDYANPFAEPGECDLSVHVDFATLSAMAELCGVAVHGAVSQGEWLNRLGLSERAQALAEAQQGRASEIAAAYHRLTATEAMGRLFRVLALSSGDWPVPAGFA
jgi:NADH dehydrogenase [ubiquinone] 1 alpha subcomplex assembly factor 7